MKKCLNVLVVLTFSSTPVFARAPRGSTRDRDRLQTPSGDGTSTTGAQMSSPGSTGAGMGSDTPHSPAAAPPTGGITNPSATPRNVGLLASGSDSSGGADATGPGSTGSGSGGAAGRAPMLLDPAV